jgi:hypothetical protein
MDQGLVVEDDTFEKIQKTAMYKMLVDPNADDGKSEKSTGSEPEMVDEEPIKKRKESRFDADNREKTDPSRKNTLTNEPQSPSPQYDIDTSKNRKDTETPKNRREVSHSPRRRKSTAPKPTKHSSEQNIGADQNGQLRKLSHADSVATSEKSVKLEVEAEEDAALAEQLFGEEDTESGRIGWRTIKSVFGNSFLTKILQINLVGSLCSS